MKNQGAIEKGGKNVTCIGEGARTEVKQTKLGMIDLGLSKSERQTDKGYLEIIQE